MTTLIERPHLSRTWICLLIGIGLTVLGAILAAGWLVLAGTMDWDIGTKLIWPNVLGPMAILALPVVVRVVALLRARYRREATYTLIGGVIGIIPVVFGTLILIGVALAGAMPRHD